MENNSNDTKKKILSAIVASIAINGPIRLTAQQVVRAWESPEYRQTLSAEQLRALPSNPAGDLQIQSPNSDKTEYFAGTQYAGCDTQYAGCNTQYAGCDTQYAGCDTQYAGCSTQFGSCIG